MVEVINALIYEDLKQLQSGQSEIKATLGDHSRQLIKIGEDINNIRGDDLRRIRLV